MFPDSNAYGGVTTICTWCIHVCDMKCNFWIWERASYAFCIRKLGEPWVYLKPVEQILYSATVPIKKSEMQFLNFGAWMECILNVAACMYVTHVDASRHDQCIIWKFPQKMLHPRNPQNLETQIPLYLAVQIQIEILACLDLYIHTRRMWKNRWRCMFRIHSEYASARMHSEYGNITYGVIHSCALYNAFFPS